MDPSIDNIIHFLKYYLPYHIAENVYFDANNTILYEGQEIATYILIEEIPVFSFVGEWESIGNNNQKDSFQKAFEAFYD